MTSPLRRHFCKDGPNYPASGLDTKLRDEERRDVFVLGPDMDRLREEHGRVMRRWESLKMFESFEYGGILFRRDAWGLLHSISLEGTQWSGRGAGGCGDIASARPVGGISKF